MSFGIEQIRVLIVEDDTLVASLIEHMLRSASARYQIGHVTSLAEAKHFLDQETVDVILLDLSLSDSIGLSTLQHMYAVAPTIPIVVMTAQEQADLDTQLLQEGAQDYLIKGQVDGHILERSLRYGIERKRIEEALRESEMRHRVLIENMPAITYLISIDDPNSWIFVSPQIRQVLGFSAEEWLASSDLRMQQLHSEDRVLFASSLEAARLYNTPVSMEFRMYTRSGQIRWLHDNRSIVSDAQGRPLYLQGIWLDVTQRRQAEESLRESEARYRALVEKLPLSVYELDREARVISINQTGLQMVGREGLQQVQGLPFQEVFPKEEIGDVGALLPRAYAGEELQIDTTSSTPSPREQRMYSTTLIPQRDADGEVNKLIGTTRDTTEQQKMRLEAEKDRDRLDAILESSNDAILMIDLDGRIALINQAFSSFFGIEPDSVIEQPAERLMVESFDSLEQPRFFQNTLDMVMFDNYRELGGELTVLRPTKRILVWYSGPVLTRADTVLGRLFIFRDATREKEADQIKAEFISIVSHELRTPLTSIKGFTDLILDGDAGEINDELREFLEIIKTSADQLVEITDDILEASRIEAGKIKLELQPIVLDEVIHSSILSMHMLIQGKEQQLETHLPKDLPEVFADRERLAQVFNNLLSNAHKYTPNGGTIQVSARVVEQAHEAHVPSDSSDGPWVVVSVADNGIGIPLEDQELLFTRFYRVSNADTQGIGGTGLGLHITRSLLELQNGAIWLESEIGQGSTFSFSLPVYESSNNQHHDQEQERSVGGDTIGQILVVEPRTPNAQMLSSLLEQAGYEVLVVNSGRTALAHVLIEPPHMLITSTYMRDIELAMFLKQLRAESRTEHLPVIAILPQSDTLVLPDSHVHYVNEPIDEHVILELTNAMVHQDQRKIALVLDDDPVIQQLLTGILEKRGYNIFVASDGAESMALIRRLRPNLVVLDLWMSHLRGFQILNALRQHPSTRDIPVIALNDTEVPAASLRRILMLGSVDLITKPPDIELLQRLVATRLDLLELAAE